MNRKCFEFRQVFECCLLFLFKILHLPFRELIQKSQSIIFVGLCLLVELDSGVFCKFDLRIVWSCSSVGKLFLRAANQGNPQTEATRFVPYYLCDAGYGLMSDHALGPMGWLRAALVFRECCKERSILVVVRSASAAHAEGARRQQVIFDPLATPVICHPLFSIVTGRPASFHDTHK